MNTLDSALVIGASRGIGLAVVRHLTSMNKNVVATWHNTRPDEDDHNVRWLRADMTCRQSMSDLVSACSGTQFDLVLINAGIYGPVHQDISRVEHHDVAALFQVNAVAPVQAAKVLLPLVTRNSRRVLGTTTSRLGSLTENPAAEMPLYAASKAALNMLTRSILNETEQQGVTLLSVHPGWVKTDMGGCMADVEPDESAAGIVSQLQQYRGRGGHHFIEHTGGVLSW